MSPHVFLLHSFAFSSLEWIRDLGLTPPDAESTTRVISRLLLAAILGGLVGFERERRGRAAGLRTHILVSVGAALFTILPYEFRSGDLRVEEIVKGIAAGIGFLGAGAILKLETRESIHGLTTAADIWLTAAVGLGCGLGLMFPALVATILALVAIVGLRWLEIRTGTYLKSPVRRIGESAPQRGDDDSGAPPSSD
ncbi:MAG TPA: MgtC/SapB family protein [Planctomycetota bacterium]|nr:MgtC/SapB family protein [Planctomycetota bacterium]